MDIKKLSNTKKKVYLMSILIIFLFAGAGTVFFVMRNHNQNKTEQNVEKQKEENYLSLGVSDRETADLYAELYEMSREDVAERQIKTKDWEKTAKELEKALKEKHKILVKTYGNELLKKYVRVSTGSAGAMEFFAQKFLEEDVL